MAFIEIRGIFNYRIQDTRRIFSFILHPVSCIMHRASFLCKLVFILRRRAVRKQLWETREG
jgi:hypothetical protein